MKTVAAAFIVVVLLTALADAGVLNWFSRKTPEEKFDECVKDDCDGQNVNVMSQLGDDAIFQYFFLPNKFLEGNGLNEYCDLHGKVKECLDTCDKGDRGFDKELLAFKSWQPYCEDQNAAMKRVMPCLKRTQEKTSECESECGLFTTMMDNLSGKIDQANQGQISQADAIQGIIDFTCDFASCKKRCQARILKQNCASDGTEAATVVNTGLKAFFDKFTSSMHQHITFPANCYDRRAGSRLRRFFKMLLH